MGEAVARGPAAGLADGHVLNNGVRWARVVRRSPVAAVLLVVVALGVLAVPFKDLHLAFPSDSTAASDTTQRRASDLMAQAFGPGREGPLLVVVDARAVDRADRSVAVGEVARWAAGAKLAHPVRRERLAFLA